MGAYSKSAPNVSASSAHSPALAWASASSAGDAFREEDQPVAGPGSAAGREVPLDHPHTCPRLRDGPRTRRPRSRRRSPRHPAEPSRMHPPCQSRHRHRLHRRSYTEQPGVGSRLARFLGDHPSQDRPARAALARPLADTRTRFERIQCHRALSVRGPYIAGRHLFASADGRIVRGNGAQPRRRHERVSNLAPNRQPAAAALDESCFPVELGLGERSRWHAAASPTK